jgi:hypothetical protein
LLSLDFGEQDGFPPLLCVWEISEGRDNGTIELMKNMATLEKARLLKISHSRAFAD